MEGTTSGDTPDMSPGRPFKVEKETTYGERSAAGRAHQGEARKARRGLISLKVSIFRKRRFKYKSVGYIKGGYLVTAILL